MMLADAAVDVVYVATPIGLHFEHGRAAIEAGKHLWCEKPLADTYGRVTALVESSETRGLTVAEAFMYLYHPQWTAVKEVVRSNRLGTVTDVRCSFGIPDLERPGFRGDPDLGGGAFLDVGCYPMSAAVELFPNGAPEVAFSQVVFGRQSAVDIAGHATLVYGSDRVVALEWRTGTSYRNELDIWGTTGSMCVDRVFSKAPDYVPRFRFRDMSGVEREEDGICSNHFIRMFEHFRSLLDDSTAAAAERTMVQRRALLRHLIRENSQRVI